jgi:hypothetical protein
MENDKLSGPRELQHNDGFDHEAEPEYAREDADPDSGRTARGGNHQQRRQTDGGRRSTRGPNGQDRPTPFIPSRERILASLARIAQLVAVGAISPSQANSTVGALTAMLRYLPAHGPGRASNVDTARLREVLRDRPDLLHAISGLMPDDELADLLNDDNENDEAETGAV